MSTASTNGIDELKRAWADVHVSRVIDPSPQILLGGVNVRFNVVKALKTVYVGAKIYFKTKKAMFTLDPWTLLEITKDAWEMVNAGLAALVQKLNKSVYTLAVVLSGQGGPVSADELRTSLDEFLKSDTPPDAPWYLHITRDHLEATRKTLQLSQGFEDLLKELERQKLARQKDGKWEFVPRNWTWAGEMELE